MTRMNHNERYTRFYKAQYLLRLVSTPRFPADYLADHDFQTCVAELVSPAVARKMKRADELLLEEHAQLHRGPIRKWQQFEAQRTLPTLTGSAPPPRPCPGSFRPGPQGGDGG